MNPKLFSLAFILILVAVAGGNPILDTDGDELHAGTPYYISPIGIGLPEYAPTRCNVGVILTTNNIPVELWPVNPNQTVITTSTKFYVKFPTAQTGCMDHNVFWQLDYDEGNGLTLIVVGSPPAEFKIVEEEKSGGYSFATRTSESLYKIGALRDVWDINTWLFMNNKDYDAPFTAVFSKASITAA